MIHWLVRDDTIFPLTVLRRKINEVKDEASAKSLLDWAASFLAVPNVGSLLALFRVVGFSGAELVGDEDQWFLGSSLGDPHLEARRTAVIDTLVDRLVEHLDDVQLNSRPAGSEDRRKTAEENIARVSRACGIRLEVGVMFLCLWLQDRCLGT